MDTNSKPKNQYILIAGSGRSGSTLLAITLNVHPEIISVGEMTGPLLPGNKADYPCACGVALGDCPFWIRVGEEMRRRGHDFGPNRWNLRFKLGRGAIRHKLLTRSLRGNRLDDIRDSMVNLVPAWRRDLGELAARNSAVVDSVLSISGRRYFFDASKDPLRYPRFARLGDIHAKVIHLVRDAPAYVNSITKKGHGTVDEAIRRWNQMAHHIERLFRRVPFDRRLRVRYEDFCQDPGSELSRISDFIGASPFDAPNDYSSLEHHVIGNRMRLTPLTKIRLDEGWKDQLDAQQIDRILKRTASYRERFGYA